MNWSAAFYMTFYHVALFALMGFSVWHFNSGWPFLLLMCGKKWTSDVCERCQQGFTTENPRTDSE